MLSPRVTRLFAGLTGFVTGAPLSLITIAMNFAGCVLLAFPDGPCNLKRQSQYKQPTGPVEGPLSAISWEPLSKFTLSAFLRSKNLHCMQPKATFPPLTVITPPTHGPSHHELNAPDHSEPRDTAH